MDKILILVMFFISLSYCNDKNEKIEYLQNSNAAYEDEIHRLKNIIAECDNNISNAKSESGYSYSDMEVALDSLEGCEY